MIVELTLTFIFILCSTQVLTSQQNLFNLLAEIDVWKKLFGVVNKLKLFGDL